MCMRAFACFTHALRICFAVSINKLVATGKENRRKSSNSELNNITFMNLSESNTIVIDLITD